MLAESCIDYLFCEACTTISYFFGVEVGLENREKSLPKITPQKGDLAHYLQKGRGLNHLLFLLGINYPSKHWKGETDSLIKKW